MSERSKLEQVLEFLLAEDNERAEELLHEYVVETARKEYERILDESDIDNNEEDAVEEFSIALGLDPENVDALVARGELFLRHGEFEDAMEDLNKAIELDPDNDHPSTMRARALAAATASAFRAAMDNQ